MFTTKFWIKFVAIWVGIVLVGAMFGQEIFVVFLTGIIVNAISGIFDYIKDQERKRENGEQHLEDLIREMGSRDNGTAIPASEELRVLGKLTDGSLNKAKFMWANLQGADLYRASLQLAKLWMINLKEADLRGSNLIGADLRGANLEGSNLHGANLQVANLRGANLEGANLWGANLQVACLISANLMGADLRGANLKGAWLEGANLIGADLRGANLEGAKFNIKTNLPDGTRWTPSTDMKKFTG